MPTYSSIQPRQAAHNFGPTRNGGLRIRPAWRRVAAASAEQTGTYRVAGGRSQASPKRIEFSHRDIADLYLDQARGQAGAGAWGTGEIPTGQNQRQYQSRLDRDPAGVHDRAKTPYRLRWTMKTRLQAEII